MVIAATNSSVFLCGGIICKFYFLSDSSDHVYIADPTFGSFPGIGVTNEYSRQRKVSLDILLKFLTNMPPSHVNLYV